MSRAGYSDDCIGGEWGLICWRGAVKRAIKGHRGQAFLAELLAALDALPEKRLISEDLIREGEVCAIGSVGKMRGVDMSTIDPLDFDTVAGTFGIAGALAREIEYINDEAGGCFEETPEQRFDRVRRWVVSQITPEKVEPEAAHA